MSGLFEDADVIFSYSRQQAIEDGVLVDVTDWATPGPFGILSKRGQPVPVAFTVGVWEAVQAPDGADENTRGRANDVLTLAAYLASGMVGGDDTGPCGFDVRLAGRVLRLWLTLDADGATIMRPEEY